MLTKLFDIKTQEEVQSQHEYNITNLALLSRYYDKLLIAEAKGLKAILGAIKNHSLNKEKSLKIYQCYLEQRLLYNEKMHEEEKKRPVTLINLKLQIDFLKLKVECLTDYFLQLEAQTCKVLSASEKEPLHSAFATWKELFSKTWLPPLETIIKKRKCMCIRSC